MRRQRKGAGLSHALGEGAGHALGRLCSPFFPPNWVAFGGELGIREQDSTKGAQRGSCDLGISRRWVKRPTGGSSRGNMGDREYWTRKGSPGQVGRQGTRQVPPLGATGRETG